MSKTGVEFRGFNNNFVSKGVLIRGLEETLDSMANRVNKSPDPVALQSRMVRSIFTTIQVLDALRAEPGAMIPTVLVDRMYDEADKAFLGRTRR